MSRQTEQLESEAEQVRAELASSLDALRDKLTPREIVDEALDYARETRVGQLTRRLSRDFQENTLPAILLFTAIAWVCMAAALRSQREMARESADSMSSQAASAAEPDLFVAHEGWGVERVREPVE